MTVKRTVRRTFYLKRSNQKLRDYDKALSEDHLGVECPNSSLMNVRYFVEPALRVIK
jgi:hypothetical protein